MTIRTLDHFLILIDDLPAAADTYSRLGFHVRPIAQHLSIGSANCIIHLGHTYLELFWLGQAPQALQDQYRPRLQAGPGLTHVCVHSDSLEADTPALKAAGVNPSPPLNARRKITRPDGREDETASASMYMWRDEHRYLSIFRSFHGKPDTIFIPEYVNHANGAREVKRCVFQSEDPAADIAYFQTLYGGPASDRTLDGFRMTGPRGEVSEVITPAAAAARYGAAAMPAAGLGSLGALPLALHYAVDSIDACRQHLRGAAVPFAEPADAIVVSADAACGVLTVFEAI